MVNRALDGMEYPNAPKGLYEPIAYVLSIGGKRLRPVLLLLVNDMFGGSADEALKLPLHWRPTTTTPLCTTTLWTTPT